MNQNLMKKIQLNLAQTMLVKPFNYSDLVSILKEPGRSYN